MNSILRALALLILAAAPSWAEVSVVSGKVSPAPAAPFAASSPTFTGAMTVVGSATITGAASVGGALTAGGVISANATASDTNGGSGITYPASFCGHQTDTDGDFRLWCYNGSTFPTVLSVDRQTSVVSVAGGIVVGSAGNTVGTLASGEYTAVMSTQTNLDLAGGASANSWRYTRVGNQVQVAGQVTLDPTAAADTDTEAFISLPISSNFDASADLSGQCTAFGAVTRSIHVVADVSKDQASLTYRAESTGAGLYACQFMYEVK